MVKSRKSLAAVLALVSAGLTAEPAQAADMYAIQLCSQIQNGDRQGIISSLEALQRIGVSDVGLDGQHFSVQEMLGVIRDGQSASDRLASAMFALNTVALMQSDYVHATHHCPVTPAGANISETINALLGGSFRATNVLPNPTGTSGTEIGRESDSSFPAGSEG